MEINPDIVNSYMNYLGKITGTSSDSYDNYADATGFYSVAYAGSLSNKPEDLGSGAWGILKVYKTSDYKMQEFVDFQTDRIYKRDYYDDVWHAWTFIRPNTERKIVPLLNDVVTTKGIFTLNDNVSNYDFIIVFATVNQWYHRQVATILKNGLSNVLVQEIPFTRFAEGIDQNIKIYDNVLDTTGSDILEGSTWPYAQIRDIYGVKL